MQQLVLKSIYNDRQHLAASAVTWPQLPQLRELSMRHGLDVLKEPSRQEWQAILNGMAASTNLTKLDLDVSYGWSYGVDLYEGGVGGGTWDTPSARLAGLTILRELSIHIQKCSKPFLPGELVVPGAALTLAALTGLTHLDLWGLDAAVGDEAATALAGSCRQLRHLKLNYCHLDSMACLANVALLTQLTCLGLYGCLLEGCSQHTKTKQRADAAGPDAAYGAEALANIGVMQESAGDARGGGALLGSADRLQGAQHHVVEECRAPAVGTELVEPGDALALPALAGPTTSVLAGIGAGVGNEAAAALAGCCQQLRHLDLMSCSLGSMACLASVAHLLQLMQLQLSLPDRVMLAVVPGVTVDGRCCTFTFTAAHPTGCIIYRPPAPPARGMHQQLADKGHSYILSLQIQLLPCKSCSHAETSCWKASPTWHTGQGRPVLSLLLIHCRAQ
ncbi:hypothetical protein COO60DRAFT_1628266 [Scenedesmus sp. NREL 46B-D3]|nr:hypothetical protein COO60DRAFT_1628266 [Scenedesmus sp. NREL 46B-D3]